MSTPLPSSKPKLRINTNVNLPQSPPQEVIAPATPIGTGGSTARLSGENAPVSTHPLALANILTESEVQYLAATVEKMSADLEEVKCEHAAFKEQFYEWVAASERGGPEAEEARRRIKAAASGLPAGKVSNGGDYSCSHWQHGQYEGRPVTICAH
jgi:hypothetical protein